MSNILTQQENSIVHQSLLQPWQTDYDLVRCYFDEEVPDSIARLCSDPHFETLMQDFFIQSSPNHQFDKTLNSVFKQLKTVNRIDELQLLINEIAAPIIDMTVSELQAKGLETLTKTGSYLFISNHRDILMDPLLLNLLLFRKEFSTAHCAIGDNLLQNPIALEFARLNKCFRIQRSLKSPKALLKAMKLQSSYVRHLRFNRRENIWIAQKEGRSKDNKDKTNPALIKMLGLARPKGMALGDYIQQLNIVPVTFSYEWDPCDIDKATELVITEDQGHYQKEAIEDFTSVKKGLLQPKGRVNIHFDDSLLNGKIANLQFDDIAEKIDASIKRNYEIYPVNWAAAQWLGETIQSGKITNGEFSQSSIQEARENLDTRLKNCPEKIRERVLKGYAAPLL
jgi:1-acyl-sn-glycerol-3-phosphate acyltransferase